jgi:hypothetical protein
MKYSDLTKNDITEIAQAAGVSRRFVHYVRTGERSSQRVEKIAKAWIAGKKALLTTLSQ